MFPISLVAKIEPITRCECLKKIILHYISIFPSLFIENEFQFGALTPLEPRLGKKLIEPLTSLIHRQVECY